MIRQPGRPRSSLTKPLQFFHKYTVTLATGIKSLGEIPMAANFTWSFLTNGAPNAPILYLPAEAATGVSIARGFPVGKVQGH